MLPTNNGKDLPHYGVILPDAPKPWRLQQPKGLHVFPEAISQQTRDALWDFFHPKNGGLEGDATPICKPWEGEFQWYQRFKRFPKTAHYNAWHSGKFLGEEGAEQFEQEYPALYAAAREAVAVVLKADIQDIPALRAFRPESVAVMRHRPGWGLGQHYDNAHDEGVGMVLMLSISNDDTVPRTFQFTDPPGGRKWPLSTYDRQVVAFGGEAYDFWQHESVHNKRQSGETISMTIRLAGVCGSRMRDAGGNIIPGSAHIPSGGGQYSTGAPAAKKVAHARIAAKRKRDEEAA
jgi:hypothetical protein